MTEFPATPSDSDGRALIPGPNGGLKILVDLPNVRRDIGFIGKTQQKTDGARYNFRGIDDALNIIGPLFVKHGITPVPQFFDHKHDVLNTKSRTGEDRSMTVVTLSLKLYLYADDGSGVCFAAHGEGREYGEDKSTSKAQSMAMKIALFDGLMVPVAPDGLDDGDRTGGDGRDEGNAVADRAPSATKREDSGAARSAFYQKARQMITDAAGDPEKLKKYSKGVQADGRLSSEEKAALNRHIAAELNKAAPEPGAKKGK